MSFHAFERSWLNQSAGGEIFLPGEENPAYGVESCGTTLLAAEFDGGVVIGADTRTSAGSFIVHRNTDKLTEVTKHIYCCRSGTASHTQAIVDIVRHHLDYYEMEHGCSAPVYVAANMFRNLCYKYRDDLTVGVIVVGWDKELGGQVYSIPLGGMIVRMPLASGGSGSTYIVGYLDAEYKKSFSRKDCEEFIKKGVALAISRDGGSGGNIRLGTITEKGIERQLITGDKVETFNLA